MPPMTNDLYTKSVLTVIALSLLGIMVQHGIGTSFAGQSGSDFVQKVAICDVNGKQCVPLYNGGSMFQAGLGVAVVNNH
jgi:hypothetical protein